MVQSQWEVRKRSSHVSLWEWVDRYGMSGRGKLSNILPELPSLPYHRHHHSSLATPSLHPPLPRTASQSFPNCGFLIRVDSQGQKEWNRWSEEMRVCRVSGMARKRKGFISHSLDWAHLCTDLMCCLIVHSIQRSLRRLKQILLRDNSSSLRCWFGLLWILVGSLDHAEVTPVVDRLMIVTYR